MRRRTLLGGALLALALLPAPAQAAGDPIMALSQVHPGMDCTARTVLQGTTISTFDVHVIGIVDDPSQGARILVSVSGPGVDQTGVAEGFSGSPVYCSDGFTQRVIGAISAGVGQYGNNVALVTPIEQMLGEPVKPPTGSPRLSVQARPLNGPLMIGGLSPALMRLVQRAGQRAGRVVLAAPAAPADDFPIQPLIPGASVATSYSSGAVPIGAIGTVTYRDGPTVYAFGHELDGAGRRTLLLQDAYVYYVVNNPNVEQDTSYKLAAAGHTEGTLTADTPNAVIGQLGAAPPLVAVAVEAHDLDSGRRLALTSQVADETDVGDPLGASLTTLVAPIEVAQAATEIYNGAPADESGRMCLSVMLRESSRPLSFCNRYVGTGPTGTASGSPPLLALSAAGDANSALSLIDEAAFAPLHIRSVSARVDAARGLDQATIVSATAPKRVRAGELVTVRLRIRVHQGALRSVAFGVRIPRSAARRLVATVANAEQLGGGGPGGPGLAQTLAQLLGAGSGAATGSSGAGSLAQLRRQFASIAIYDGLAVQFKNHPPMHVYRDPGLVIVGQARLAFQVVGGRQRR